jgi:uncharacterized protein
VIDSQVSQFAEDVGIAQWRNSGQNAGQHPAMSTKPTIGNPLKGLQDIRKISGRKAPLEAWNPPFCGNIDMRIAADGTWFYLNSPIGRKPLVELFASVLRREKNDYFLVTPVEKCGIQVEDAPFVAVSLHTDGAGANQVLTFETNVDDEVKVSAQNPLRFQLEPRTGGLKPYVLVRAGLEALVTRSIFYDLVALGTVHGDWFGVWSCDVFFPMQRAAELDTRG